MVTELSTTLLALFIGWLLSEGSRLLRYSDAKKSSIRVALAELLEIRHRVISNQFLFDQVEEHLSLPPRVVLQLRNELPSLLTSDPEASQRLSEAVSDVAKYDPFLAYKIRGKNIIGTVEQALNPEQPQDDLFADYLLAAQKDLRSHLLPVLDSVILSTAVRSGFIDWFRALRKIRYEPLVSYELQASADNFMRSMKEQLKAYEEHKH